VTLERIAGGRHWSVADPSACSVTVTENDAQGVAGNATCKGLRWFDAMSSAGALQPSEVDGEPAFDAVITFSAAP